MKKKLVAAVKAVYASPAVREHAVDLVKVVVGVVLAHYGIKYA